jgi:Xaa-Pro aminopeptidase
VASFDQTHPDFDPRTFAARRSSAFRALGRGAMVLPAAPLQYRAGDSEYRYRPDSSLFYLTGLTEPGCVAVLRGHAEEDRFVLFVRERDAEAEQWSGERIGPERACELLGADAAYPLKELAERLPGMLQGSDGLYFRLGSHEASESAVRGALVYGRTRGTRKGLGPRSVADPGVILEPLRMRKEPGEIEAIRAAAALTVQGFRRALPGVRPGRGEWQVQADLESVFLAQRAEPAFATIVGSGPRGCVLHYVDNREIIAEGDLVLVDAGADLDLYAGDVTRTVPASGRFTGEQRAVHDVVSAAQRAAVATIRPGVPVSDVHLAAVRLLTEGLVHLGVLRGDPAALVEEEAYKPFYPHQTSHWLGLDVHDVGVYGTGGESVVLEEGMVLTVEPGLYFLPGAEGVPDAFSGIGIRLEDDVVVTREGHENLTGDLPLSADSVEEWLGRG